MDDLADFAQPHYPEDGIVMRDAPGAWVCGECGYRVEQLEVRMPAGFDGPSIEMD